MILFPAIDLKDGACVRLLRGDMEAATVFNDSPADQARAFVEAGAQWLHIVDLNGAFDGESVNGDAVRAILDVTRAAGVRVQLGGGIRTPEHVSGWLADGIDRVILGTAAVKNPDLVIASCRGHPGQVAVGIDARGGRVAVEGWAETSDLAADELAARFADVGVAAVIYTDIDRDGAMEWSECRRHCGSGGSHRHSGHRLGRCVVPGGCGGFPAPCRCRDRRGDFRTRHL